MLSRISRMLIYFLAAAKRTKNLFGQMNKHLSKRVLFIWIACEDAERKWSEDMQCKQKEKDLEEKVIEISTERLKGFKNHPFKVINDQQMEALRESIGRFGILNPIIVRPKLEGYYEIVSGHRRCEAARQLGFTKVPVLIRVLSDDEAILEMVDSNVQREQISHQSQ